MRSVFCLADTPPARAHRILFERLFEHGAGNPPRASVTREEKKLITRCCDQILAGETLEYADNTWGRFLGAESWEESAAARDSSYGLAALSFLDCASEAVQRFGPVEMPVCLALRALILCQHEPSAIDIVGVADQAEFRVTTYGSAALGVTSSADVDERVPLDERCPRKLFEAYYTGGSAKGGPARRPRPRAA